MTFTSNADGTYTLTLAPEEAVVVSWARTNHAPDILEQVLTGWLRGEAEYMLSKAGRDAIAAIQAAPLADLQAAVDGVATMPPEKAEALKRALGVFHGAGP